MVRPNCNRVADCLSRYYETDRPDETHPAHEFVSADAKLDLEAKLLPVRRYIEICSTAARQSHRLAGRVEQRVLDSAELNQGTTEVPSEPSDDAPLASESGTVSRIITASILHFKEHSTYCLRLSMATST